VHLWRRLSARQDRSFEDAFAGVFGAGPADMYGAFTVALTDRALQVRARLRDAGLVEGGLVQRLNGATGEPAVSPDGSRLAVVLRPLRGPSRLVVIPARPDPDSALRRARERMLQRDSLDVAPFDSFPRPRRALATLHPFHGRSHEQPRWMPDGVTVLVTRDEPAPNGVTRPDVFAWNTRTGAVRRVTRGAGIRQADPSPDGRHAVAVRCHAGMCSVVVISLETGAWRELVRGNPELVWHRPRYSPDGSRIAAGYQEAEAGQWNVAIIDAATGAVQRLAGDGEVSRFSPAFMPDRNEVVVVSDRGGIPNLELVPLEGGPPQSLTRVTGAVAGPDVSRTDSTIWFLSLRSGGYDLRRLGPSRVAEGDVVAIRGALAPAAPPTGARASLPPAGTTSAVTARDYGLGPRRWRFLPGGTAGPDGHTATLMAANIDPIGRLSVLTQGSYGSPGTWRGGSAVAGLRRLRIGIDAGVWYVEHEPSLARDHLTDAGTDVQLAGAGLQARLNGEGSNTAYVARATIGSGQARNGVLARAWRTSVSGELRGRLSIALGRVNVSTIAGLFAESGTTDGEGWARAIGSATLSIGTARYQLRGDWLRGSVTSPSLNGFGRALEQFVVGGATNPLIDPAFLSQRIPLPSVPAGFLSGNAIQLFKGTLGGRPLEPYFVWLNDGTSFENLKRIAGIERTFGIASLGFARLPGFRARAGASYSFDEPYRHRARAYASLVFSP
jgi:Tol biopolymer transport system component